MKLTETRVIVKCLVKIWPVLSVLAKNSHSLLLITWLNSSKVGWLKNWKLLLLVHIFCLNQWYLMVYYWCLINIIFLH